MTPAPVSLALIVRDDVPGIAHVVSRARPYVAEVVVVAALDSIYAGLGADGQPLPADIAPWVALAEEAVAGGCAFVVGASAIDYMETAPAGQRYASTGRVADAIAHALGLAPADSRRVSTTAGSLVLAHYPGQDAAAHIAAVRGWGPALVADGVRLWLGEHQAAPTEPPPATLPADVLRAAVLGGVEGALAGARAPRAVHSADRARGADVSRWQGPGEGNAWPLWRCRFGFARVATSGKRDDTFAANWQRMAELELRGAYAWFDPGRSTDEQADVALATLKAAGVDPRGLKLAIDVEPGPYGENAAGLARWRALTGDGAGMTRWVERMRDAGCDAGCYTGRWAWFWGSLLADLGCWLWVADASGASLAAGRPLLIPAGWPAWDQAEPLDWARPGARPLIWQCGTQVVPGESAPVDLDWFRGDVAALREWGA